MKKLVVLVLMVVASSCQFLKPEHKFRFVYGFENDANISNIEVQKTIKVLETRLTSFGVRPEIKRFGKNQIEVLIEASKLNIDQVDNLISNRGKLEFWELYKGNDMLRYLIDFDSEQNKGEQDNTAKIKLMELATGVGYEGGPVICQFKEKDTSFVNQFITEGVLKQKIPMGQHKVKFLWGLSDNGNIPLYAVKSNREHKAPLTGMVITNVYQSIGYSDRPEISIEMNEEGALVWERITGKAFQNASQIAIVLNDIVYSAPGVTVGPIKGGKSSISGDFTLEEAQNLALILSSRYPIPQLKLLEQTTLKNN